MGDTSSIQSHPQFSIDQDKICKKADGYHSIYTVDAIRNERQSFLFQIIKSGAYMRIGIDDGQTENSNFTTNKESENWGYDTDGTLWSKGHTITSQKKSKYGIKYGDGDIVSMDINMTARNGYLSFTVNNKKQQDIPIKPSLNGYRVAIYMYYQNYAIKIMPSTKQERNEEHETVQSLTDELNLYKIKHIKDEQDKRDKQTEINELRVTIQTLQKELSNTKTYTTTLSNYLNESQELVLSLQKEAKDLKATLIEKERTNVCLLEEQKESVMKIEELKEDAKQLKAMNIDETRYFEWENAEILQWILSLENQRYAKYESVLRNSLKEERVKGIHLQKVNESDVKGWGVKAFDDKKDLTQSIHRLVHTNMEPNYQNYQNEGAQTACI